MRIIRIAVAFAIASILSCARPFAAEQCTPFGDPPAQVNQDFRQLVCRTQSDLLQRPRARPWKIRRNRPLRMHYEPEQHSRDNPLPLVVFLHGSIATADSIKLTGLSARSQG